MTTTKLGRQNLFKYLGLMVGIIIFVPTIIILTQGLINGTPLNPSFNLTTTNLLELIIHILGQIIAIYFLGPIAAKQIIDKGKNSYVIGILTIMACWTIFFIIVTSFTYIKYSALYSDREISFIKTLDIIYFLGYSFFPSLIFGSLFGKQLKNKGLQN